MKRVEGIKLSDVITSWSGDEWRFWPEFFGEQLHIGGLRASQELADKAGIQPGSNGVEFCCGTGGASRFLIRFRKVATVQAVDVSEVLVNLARERTKAEGFQEKINFIVSDVSNSGLPSGHADFVWGEDAWVYVPDKARLVAEAVRVLRPGGTIAFYDWCEGSNLSGQEAARLMRYHKFPTLAGLDDYRALLENAGCEILRVEDTKRLDSGLELVLDQIQKQKTYDALRLLNWNEDALSMVCGELALVHDLAKSGKLIQGLFVARKTQ